MRKMRALWRGGESGNEGAAHADRILAKALCPQAFKTDPDGRQNGHVEDSKQRFGNGLRGREIEGHATEAEVYDSGAVNRLVSEGVPSELEELPPPK